MKCHLCRGSGWEQPGSLICWDCEGAGGFHENGDAWTAEDRDNATADNQDEDEDSQ